MSAKTRILHRQIRGKLPVAVRGEGVYIIDSEGKSYLDACEGEDGRRGNHILLAPPFIFNDNNVAELVDKLGAAVDGALKELGLAV